MKEVIKELKSLFKENIVPIRPNRSYRRDYGKYRRRLKPKVSKNQKDAIWKILNLMTLPARDLNKFAQPFDNQQDIQRVFSCVVACVVGFLRAILRS